MVSKDHDLSQRRQCVLLQLSRSTLYSSPKSESAENLEFMEILDDRVGISSTVVCGQMPVASWHDYIGDAAIADAVLDRLTAAAHRLELEGPSMRRKSVNVGT